MQSSAVSGQSVSQTKRIQSNSNKQGFQLSPIKNGIRLAMLCATMSVPVGGMMFSNLVQAQVEQRQYAFDIESGSLESTLMAFSTLTDITVSFAPDVVEGLSSPGTKGNYRPNEALAILLQGSGLEAIAQGNGSYSVVKPSVALNRSGLTELAPATVNSAERLSGSAEVGYRIEQTNNIGPINGAAIIDTPYSVAVVSSSLLENTIAGNPDQIFRMSPTIQLSTQTNSIDVAAIFMRGFSSSRGLTDGIPTSNNAINLEDIEQVDILTGTSGFLYGAGNVGGRVNFNYKRPTQERLTKLTVGNYGGEQYFIHADLGGAIDDKGIFGYRLNLVKQDGETAREDENIDKLLITGAFDWHLSDSILAGLVLSYRDYEVDGKGASWFFFSTSEAFDAPDISKAYAPEWNRLENKTSSLKFDLKWDINEAVALRTSYFTKKVDSPVNYETRNMVLNELYAGFFGAMAGDFYQSNQRQTNKDIEESGGNIFLDASFDTAGIQHNMTLGYSSNKYQYSSEGITVVPALHSNLDDLNTTPEPDWSLLPPNYFGTLNESANSNIIIADEITFNEKWSTQFGLNYTSLESKAGLENVWDETGYDKSALTPAVSILYKPINNLTSYFTYMEALEPGTIVGSSYSNAGEILEPLLGEEIELGIKYELRGGDLLLTAALFRIEKANEYSILGANPVVDPPVFVQDGLAVHQGFELGITGKATENITLQGGLTLMDASTKKSNNPDLEGRRPERVANNMAKLYGEYAFPSISGLVLTGGIYYTGSSYWNQIDDTKTKPYTLVDIGLRYSSIIANTPMTFRFAVANITDENYWLNKWSLGTPRTLAFSMSMNF